MRFCLPPRGMVNESFTVFKMLTPEVLSRKQEAGISRYAAAYQLRRCRIQIHSFVTEQLPPDRVEAGFLHGLQF